MQIIQFTLATYLHILHQGLRGHSPGDQAVDGQCGADVSTQQGLCSSIAITQKPERHQAHFAALLDCSYADGLNLLNLHMQTPMNNMLSNSLKAGLCSAFHPEEESEKPVCMTLAGPPTIQTEPEHVWEMVSSEGPEMSWEEWQPSNTVEECSDPL